MQLSIVIPALNEAQTIRQTLLPLQPLRRNGHEVILCDGGSDDATTTLATALTDQVINSPRGRARQMNAGALQASGELLLFLHADTQLPAGAADQIARVIQKGPNRWGRFDVRLSGRAPLLRVVERMMNWRSRLSGIATGDQGIFVTKELFQQVGGFPEIELMEDIALSRLLKRHSPPACLKECVTTSSRRWEQQGIIRTILLMWRLRLAYFCGAAPQRLARLYHKQ